MLHQSMVLSLRYQEMGELLLCAEQARPQSKGLYPGDG